MLRTVVTVLSTAVVLYVGLVALAAIFQRQLIYLPDASTPRAPPAVEPMTYPSADGHTLEAWFLPAEDEPISTIIATPGNAGNRELRLPLAMGLIERGHSVLLIDYRGFGGNPGSPSEDAMVADTLIARDRLAARADVDAERLVYLGESIGSGVASAIAAQSPPAALVLRSPFPELVDVGRSAYPFLPVRLLLRERYAIADHVAVFDGPVLVVAGDEDSIVPTRLSRRVAEGADAEYVEIPGADHNDRALLDGARYLDAVDGFIRDHLGAR